MEINFDENTFRNYKISFAQSWLWISASVSFEHTPTLALLIRKSFMKLLQISLPLVMCHCNCRRGRWEL